SDTRSIFSSLEVFCKVLGSLDLFQLRRTYKKCLSPGLHRTPKLIPFTLDSLVRDVIAIMNNIPNLSEMKIAPLEAIFETLKPEAMFENPEYPKLKRKASGAVEISVNMRFVTKRVVIY
ncbi:MAG: hypothetical protein QG646_1619, partial [Euryarchaeota archaeon]|nr:hypothetical protein [Euryarchaeota archaeon]